MKRFTMFFVLTTMVYAFSVSPVPYVSAEKFSGLWYEIARTYNSYQEDCVASSVEYIHDEDDAYTIYNRCFEKVIGGDLIEYKGVATPYKDDSFSQINLTYYLFFTKKYQIIYLDDAYETAVMADEDLEQLWIMHRKPMIDQEKLSIVTTLLARHMDLSKLIYTLQDMKGRYK